MCLFNSGFPWTLIIIQLNTHTLTMAFPSVYECLCEWFSRSWWTGAPLHDSLCHKCINVCEWVNAGSCCKVLWVSYKWKLLTPNTVHIIIQYLWDQVRSVTWTFWAGLRLLSDGLDSSETCQALAACVWGLASIHSSSWHTEREKKKENDDEEGKQYDKLWWK